MRDKAVIPHVAQNTSGRRSAIDERTTRHPGYAISQRIRKRVEEAFGWAKTVAGLRKMRHRGLPKVDWQFTLAMAAYDLVRLPKLLAEVVDDPPENSNGCRCSADAHSTSAKRVCHPKAAHRGSQNARKSSIFSAPC